MKSLRILSALVGTIALIGMFSCGGSQFSTEPSSGWNEENIVLQFHAVSLDSPEITSTQNHLSNVSKDFFADDNFSSFGQKVANTGTESINLDCQFDAPVAAAISGVDYANISIVADDPATCADLRNCCVYTIDPDYVDPCAITIECILDPLLTDLNNTQLNLAFNVRQYMETNMQNDSGLIVTAIMENGSPNDENIFSLNTATINRSDCAATTDRFVLNNDDPWAAIASVENGQDILDHGDYLWNVDTIGAVDIVGEFSECTLYYENMTGSISLEPISSGGSVVKDTLLNGSGKICNSQSHTDCEGDATIEFDYTLDMYEPTLYGDDLTFAQAGVSHICGSGESDMCHPTAAFSTCLPYLINGASAPDGCLNLCMDLTGLLSWPPDGLLQDPNASLFSQYARDIYDNQGGDYDAACTAAGGVLQDIGTGGMLCLPDQYSICAGGGAASFYTPSTDNYTVEDSGAGADKTTAEVVSAIFDAGAGVNNLSDLSDECTAAGDMRARMQTVQFFGTLIDNVSSPDCNAVAERFIDDIMETDPDLRALNGQFSVELVDDDGDTFYDHLKIFFNDGDVNPSHPMASLYDNYYGEKQLFWDQALGIDRTWLGAEAVQDGVSIDGIAQADRRLYARDGVTYVEADIEIGWVNPTEVAAQGRGNAVDNHYTILFHFEQDTQRSPVDCGDGGMYGFYLDVIGSSGGNDGCDSVDKYNRGDGYIANGGMGNDEETAVAAMSTMFETGTTVDGLDGGADEAADWSVVIPGTEKTLRDYWENCNATYASNLAAIPYYRNTNVINTDDSIDDVCRNVAQRFTSTVLAAEGTDQLLTPHPLSIEFDSSGTQGLTIRIEDGSVPGTPVFEDISGEYIVDDGSMPATPDDPTKIPAAGTTFNVTTQWFSVGQRVSLQLNYAASGAKSGHRMSVYTTGGTDYNPTVLDGYEKVGTHLDFHRIRELDLHSPTPENVYLMIIALMEPVDSSNSESGLRCGFDQQFVIDGTCMCELDDSCP